MPVQQHREGVVLALRETKHIEASLLVQVIMSIWGGPNFRQVSLLTSLKVEMVCSELLARYIQVGVYSVAPELVVAKSVEVLCSEKGLLNHRCYADRSLCSNLLW